MDKPIQWTSEYDDKIDTVQARAQLEALRAIAEELRELNARIGRVCELVAGKDDDVPF